MGVVVIVLYYIDKLCDDASLSHECTKVTSWVGLMGNVGEFHN